MNNSNIFNNFKPKNVKKISANPYINDLTLIGKSQSDLYNNQSGDFLKIYNNNLVNETSKSINIMNNNCNYNTKINKNNNMDDNYYDSKSSISNDIKRNNSYIDSKSGHKEKELYITDNNNPEHNKNEVLYRMLYKDIVRKTLGYKHNLSDKEVLEIDCCFSDHISNDLSNIKRESFFIEEESYKIKDLHKNLIYSINYLLPFSFLNGQSNYGFNKDNNLKFPSPKYLTNEDFVLLPKEKIIYDNFLKGSEIDNHKGIICVDKNILRRFTGIVGDMIKQIVKNLFGGPPVSLSVRIFEVRSSLHRFSDMWSYAGLYLNNVYNIDDISNLNVNNILTNNNNNNNSNKSLDSIYLKNIKFNDKKSIAVEKFKQIISFGVAGMILTIKQIKPFNPLIGETFEGQFFKNNSIKMYAEHIGHYPTLSRFYMIDDSNKFKLYTCMDLKASPNFTGSVIKIIQKGKIVIEFPCNKNKQKYIYTLPVMKLENCTSDTKRNGYIIDNMEFYDVTNNLKAVIKFGYNDNKVIDFIGGIIDNYTIDEINIESDKECKSSEKYIKIIQDNNKIIFGNDLKKKENLFKKTTEGCPINIITGQFTNCIEFHEFHINNTNIDKSNNNNNKYWDFYVQEPDYVMPLNHVLPSDTRFREDLIWLYYALYYSQNKKEYDLFMEYAQGWKVEIELIQRKERGIRADYKKKLEKDKKNK